MALADGGFLGIEDGWDGDAQAKGNPLDKLALIVNDGYSADGHKKTGWAGLYR